MFSNAIRQKKTHENFRIYTMGYENYSDMSIFGSEIGYM